MMVGGTNVNELDAKNKFLSNCSMNTDGKDSLKNAQHREDTGKQEKAPIENDKEKCEQTTQEQQYQREWYLHLNNVTQGPFHLQELLELWTNCIINHMTYVYRSGETSWKYIGNYDVLIKYFSENSVRNSNTPVVFSINNYNSTVNETGSRNMVKKETDKPQWEEGTNVNNIDTSGCKIKEQNEEISEEQNNEPIEPTAEDLEKMKKKEKKKRYLERRKRKIEEGLSDKKIKNSSVYITGLPKDVTKQEINNVFKKAGIIKIDAESTEPKIKIYYDENNNVKGDALVTYVYRRSVDIAVKYFDKFYFRQDCLIRVEKAQFNANTDSNKKREKEVTLTKEEKILKKKKIMAAKCEQMRLQNWGIDMYTGGKKKILIFRNVFSYDQAKQYDEGDPFYDSIKSMLEMALLKYTSTCKVYPIPKHPKGIVCVKCKTAEEAEMLVTCFNDKNINGNKLEVYFYDGKQDLKAQCLKQNKEEFSNKENVEKEKDPLPTDHNKESSNFFNESWESFDEWVENQSEDEEHKINVE